MAKGKKLVPLTLKMPYICDICKKYFTYTSSEYERRLVRAIPQTELRAIHADYKKMLVEEEEERRQSPPKQPLSDDKGEGGRRE